MMGGGRGAIFGKGYYPILPHLKKTKSLQNLEKKIMVDFNVNLKQFEFQILDLRYFNLFKLDVTYVRSWQKVSTLTLMNH